MAAKKTGSSTPDPKRVAAAKPMSDTHKQFLTLVAKGVVTVESAAKRGMVLEQRMEAAVAKAVDAAKKAQLNMKTASQRTTKNITKVQAKITLSNVTAQAKTAVASAKAQAKKATRLWSDMTKAVRAEEKALERAVRAAEAERVREMAKQQAAKAFVSQWEREHRKRKEVHKRIGSAA